MFWGVIENNTPVADKILWMKNTDTFLPKMNAFINFNVKKKVKLKNLETDQAANHHSQFDPLRAKLGSSVV